MNRQIERWQIANPQTMAQQSEAAIMYAFQNARHDVLELHDQNKRLRELLRPIAYPHRGTAEETMTLLQFAELIQSVYTSEQLEQP